jgi:hypothetical protein
MLHMNLRETANAGGVMNRNGTFVAVAVVMCLGSLALFASLLS